MATSVFTENLTYQCWKPSSRLDKALSRCCYQTRSPDECPCNAFARLRGAARQLVSDDSYSNPAVAETMASRTVWPALKQLSLPNQLLGWASMEPLLHISWSQLQELDLSFNYLHTDSIECLVKCDWPCLRSLSLSYDEIHVDAVDVLVQGNWRRLEHLDLHGNSLCEAACQCLVRGAWPYLALLGLSSVGLDLNCFRQPSARVLA